MLRINLARKASRVRVFEIGRVFRRDAGVPDGALTVAGVHQPMRVAGLASGSADGLQWGRKEQGVDFFDVKGDVEALLAPRRPVFVADTHPALHPGRCARVELDGRAIGHVGELHPQWRQAYELPQAPMLFELDLDARARLARCRSSRPCRASNRPGATWRWCCATSVGHDALMARLRDDPAGLVRRRHAVRHLQAGRRRWPASEAGERSLAVRLELLDDDATLTDERIDAAVAAAVARAQQPSAPACAPEGEGTAP